MARTPPHPSQEQQEYWAKWLARGRKKRDIGRGLLSRLDPPIGTKSPPFVPVGGSIRDHWSPGPLVPVGDTNRDKCKRPLPPTLLRPGVRSGTKALFDSGSKDNWDKWLGPKTCSVVVSDCLSMAKIPVAGATIVVYRQDTYTTFCMHACRLRRRRRPLSGRLWCVHQHTSY